MSFIVDKQTLDDLNIVGKYKGNSIYNLFNRTKTRGGERILERMFQNPLTNDKLINERSAIIRFFQLKKHPFEFDKKLFNQADHFLSSSSSRTFSGAVMTNIRRKIMFYITVDREYDEVKAGVLAIQHFLSATRKLIEPLAEGDTRNNPYKAIAEKVLNIISVDMDKFVKMNPGKKMSLLKTSRWEHFLRYTMRSQFEMIMNTLYEVDVYTAVGEVAEERGFHYSHAVPFEKGKNQIAVENVFHPQIRGAVKNSITLDNEKNILFLTGANMAGKSTFMKSFSIALYLAHMGFPVAADSMEFSVQDGIYTSINVPDNISLGYSHFYAEVLRVKTVSEEVSRGKNMLIIFDELFKGTNVKDAYDATVAVSEAFSVHTNCMYIISTHILEAGKTLEEHCKNMHFVYFPTLLEKGRPVYTYKLEGGISGDRHGMMIIRNEGILETIKKAN